MGFNFGAFLGGAATQITKDIDEEEKRVKLRMDKILDRQQELTIQNQKEFKAKKEKVTNQMNALVPLFGGGPDAIAKARSIVAGGDNHYNFMFSKLTAAQERGDNINEIYSLIPNKDAVGFESVEDATGSLVKMAELPEITIGESSNMAKLFGIDQKAYFNRERQKLVEVGQIISGDKTPTETNFAQGKLNLDKMSKDFKSVSEMQEYKFASELKKLTPGSNEHKAKLAEYEKFKKGEAELTAGYLIAKYKEDNDNKTEGLSAASMQLGWQKEKAALEKKYEKNIISSVTGKPLRKGVDKDFDAEVKKKIDAYNYAYVKGIVTDTTGLNVNGLAVISANPELKKLLPIVKKDLEDAMTTEEGKPKSEVKDIDPKIRGTRSLFYNKIGKITDNVYGLKVTEEMKKKYPEVFKNKKVGSHFTLNEKEYKILPEQKNIQEKKSDVTKDKKSDDGILVSGARKIEGFFKKPPKLDGQAVQQDKDTGKYYLVIGTGRKKKRGRELTPDEIKRLK